MSWDKKLPRPIVLKNGTKLATLSDLRGVVVKLPPMLKDDALERGLELLLKAGETGRNADIKAAAHQMTIVLRVRQMMGID